MTFTTEITIPVLNEAETIYDQVRKVHAYLREELRDLGDVTVVIADNGSKDGTPEIARRLQGELDGVRYHRLEERGVGRALKASWGASNADIVGYMDLDLATDLRYLRPALEQLQKNEADIVTGSRLAKGAVVIGRTPLREFTSRAMNLIVKAVFGTRFSDGMCGFKFLRRSCLGKIREAGAVSDGWFFATELLIAGEYLGFRVRDIPVEWRDDPNSKVRIMSLSIEYLKAMKVLRGRLPPKAVIR